VVALNNGGQVDPFVGGDAVVCGDVTVSGFGVCDAPVSLSLPSTTQNR
jgi:hypothetical protein